METLKRQAVLFYHLIAQLVLGDLEALIETLSHSNITNQKPYPLVRGYVALQ